MRLGKLIKSLDVIEVIGIDDYDEEIEGVSYNSKKTKKNDIFVCLTGEHVDGHEYAEEAYANGALVCIVERRLSINAPQIVVSSTAEIIEKVASELYNKPSEKLNIIGVTGTNGKTTTTTLVGEIMKAHLGEEKVFVVGNIGNPYTLESMKTTPETVTVGELSSFQLETVHTFHPKVSAILNVTPDHLDRHHTMEAYAAAKEAIAAGQTKEDICVLNYNDPYTKAFGERCSASVVYFSSKDELENGYFLRGEYIMKAVKGNATSLLHIHTDMNLVGICNVENVMAAIAISQRQIA